MGQRRRRNLYAETTDRHTFNIIHIRNVTSCCLRCNIRQRQTWYYIFADEYKEKHPDRTFRERQPSWKLVSKRKKQWMRRPIKIKEDDRWRTISW